MAADVNNAITMVTTNVGNTVQGSVDFFSVGVFVKVKVHASLSGETHCSYPGVTWTDTGLRNV